MHFFACDRTGKADLILSNTHLISPLGAILVVENAISIL